MDGWTKSKYFFYNVTDNETFRDFKGHYFSHMLVLHISQRLSRVRICAHAGLWISISPQAPPPMCSHPTGTTKEAKVSQPITANAEHSSCSQLKDENAES